jgi:hypothetical protein
MYDCCAHKFLKCPPYYLSKAARRPLAQQAAACRGCRRHVLCRAWCCTFLWDSCWAAAGVLAQLPVPLLHTSVASTKSAPRHVLQKFKRNLGGRVVVGGFKAWCRQLKGSLLFQFLTRGALHAFMAVVSTLTRYTPRKARS